MSGAEQEARSPGHLGGPEVDVSGRNGPTGATPLQVFASGASAYSAGRWEEAAAAFQQAMDSNHPGVAAMAAGELGGLRREQGRLDEAAAAYQWAVDSDSDIAPFVAVALGDVRRAQGRFDEAVTAFQHAIDSMHPDIAPLAAIKLQSMNEH